MDPQQAVDLGRQALMMSMVVGAPLLVAGVVVGLVIGLLQALTQIQEQTVAFVPKLVVMLLVLALCMPWLMQKMIDYTHDLITNIPHTLGGV